MLSQYLSQKLNLSQKLYSSQKITMTFSIEKRPDRMWVCVHVCIYASFCVACVHVFVCACVCVFVCVSVHGCVCGKFVQDSVRMYCMRLTACSGAVGRTKLTQGLIHRIRYRPIINATPTLHQCYINATSMLQLNHQ